MPAFLRSLLFFLAAATVTNLAAQPGADLANVSGRIVDPANDQPVAAVAVALHAAAHSAPLQTATTNVDGSFAFASVPPGEYRLVYGRAEATQETAVFALKPEQPSHQAGRLPLAGDSPVVKLEKFEVSAQQQAFYNSIDRKVYNVGQDIQSLTGSASDLLQNIPSIQVDVEGEISLRGDSNVQILVNGKSSALLNGSNRAVALEQMSAGRISRVEVVTNPSAKYSPEGTGGIINLILEKPTEPGYLVSTRTSVGNEGRYSASITANFNPGKVNVTGGVSIRQDERARISSEERVHLDGSGGVRFSTSQQNSERSQPFSRSADFGIEYELGQQTELSTSLELSSRRTSGSGIRTNRTRDAGGALTADFDRLRSGPESETEFEFRMGLDHAFDARDRELAIELSYENERESETENYTSVYRLPLGWDEQETTRAKNRGRELEFSADYVHPLGDYAKVETGYALEAEKTDEDLERRQLNPVTGSWSLDPETSNRFIYESAVHAFYATYGRSFGRFGFLGGLRFEQTFTQTNQLTAALRDEHDYARLYPSLHLSYKLSDAHRLHLSYSHRVNRPDGDELNPYPRFDDPLNVETGNPELEPEDIHSLEAGYEYQHQDTTYLATIYHRQRYNGVTEVTRLVGNNTLVTRPENLATSDSSGLELGAARSWRKRLSLHLSANVYRNQIDARNLGFTTRRTALAWDAKFNTNWKVSDSFALQLTSSYRAKRLTAQGERLPSHITNLGARYTLKNRRTSVVLTVSDVLNSLQSRSRLDTPTLRSDVTQRRSGRIVYLGITHSFGRSTRDSEEKMQFDENL